MIPIKNAQITPGSTEKHVLMAVEGESFILRDDFANYISSSPKAKELLADFVIPTPMSTEVGRMVVFFIPPHSVVELKHPTHPTVRHEGGETGMIGYSFTQVEYNPLRGEIMQAWD